jgi:hypothetical protein
MRCWCKGAPYIVAYIDHATGRLGIEPEPPKEKGGSSR